MMLGFSVQMEYDTKDTESSRYRNIPMPHLGSHMLSLRTAGNAGFPWRGNIDASTVSELTAVML